MKPSQYERQKPEKRPQPFQPKRVVRAGRHAVLVLLQTDVARLAKCFIE
jgi:hypothetical protein